ncbi:unnamed protein product [Ciceribacter sp. T2.26MG-112.2]|nr:unnamed protein product [Ciceribacter naphthalenivorans]
MFALGLPMFASTSQGGLHRALTFRQHVMPDTAWAIGSVAGV